MRELIFSANNWGNSNTVIQNINWVMSKIDLYKYYQIKQNTKVSGLKGPKSVRAKALPSNLTAPSTRAGGKATRLMAWVASLKAMVTCSKATG